jgi:hypothetical protein
MWFTPTGLIEGWLKSGFVIIGRDRRVSLTARRTKPYLAHGTLTCPHNVGMVFMS